MRSCLAPSHSILHGEVGNIHLKIKSSATGVSLFILNTTARCAFPVNGEHRVNDLWPVIPGDELITTDSRSTPFLPVEQEDGRHRRQSRADLQGKDGHSLPW